MKGKISLTGMEFHAFHGCLEQEKTDGNTFIVDFEGKCDMTAAAQSDRIEDAVDYSCIYGIVAREMAIPSDLLEHVTGRIVMALAEAFPELETFSVRVSKKNPPVKGPVIRSSVTIEYPFE